MRFNADKEKQATWYVKEKINNQIKNNYLSEEKDIDSLQQQLQSLCDVSKCTELYNSRVEAIDKIISDKRGEARKYYDAYQ